MSDPFIGEIKAVGFNFSPVGYAFCQGQLMNISQHAPLYSLLSDTYGGDGRTNFALPDLRGRVAMGVGRGQASRYSYSMGNYGGVDVNQLSTEQMPMHTHTLFTSSGEGTSAQGREQVLASAGAASFTAEVASGIPVSGAIGREPLTEGKTTATGAVSGSVNARPYGAPTSLQPMHLNAIGQSGNGAPIDNRQPFLAINYIIALEGLYPSRS